MAPIPVIGPASSVFRGLGRVVAGGMAASSPHGAGCLGEGQAPSMTRAPGRAEVIAGTEEEW
jgi:hypothetical protein